MLAAEGFCPLLEGSHWASHLTALELTSAAEVEVSSVWDEQEGRRFEDDECVSETHCWEFCQKTEPTVRHS